MDGIHLQLMRTLAVGSMDLAVTKWMSGKRTVFQQLTLREFMGRILPPSLTDLIQVILARSSDRPAARVQIVASVQDTSLCAMPMDVISTPTVWATQTSM